MLHRFVAKGAIDGECYRRFLYTLLLAPLFFVSGYALAQTPDAYGTTWKPLAIGAGGWLVGMDIAPDGTKVVRTDTYGAFLWNRSQWVQLVNAGSMPPGDVNVDNQEGVYEIRIAPSNTSRLYMMYLGAVYRSDNRGSTWTRTAFTPVTGSDPNDDYRMNGEKMAVDPVNPDVVYVGTTQNGLWVSADAGTSWSRVTSVPAGTGGITGIAFDPTSGQTSGKTNTIYAGSWGNGVYRSTNAGGAWTKTAGGPTTVHNAVVATDGIYYAVDGTAAYKYAAGVWTTINSSSGWHSVAVDPANPARIILGDDGGYLSQSLDRGATWPQGVIWGSSAHPVTRVATDIPWLAWTNEAYMSSGNMIFDPTASNKLYFSEGIGVWYTSIATNQSWDVGPSWYSQSLGIEQLVANKVISPPGGKPVVASWDRPVFHIDNPDVYPSTHGPDNQNSIVMGWGLDYASSNPTFVAAVMNWNGTEKSGYSTDGGQTWKPFASYPPFASADKIGGDIAVSTPSNMVWTPNGNGVPYYTTNGGASWVQANFPGAATSGETGWGWSYYLDRQIIAADRVNTGTFYAYNYLRGLYRSSNGGTTWVLVKSGEIVPFSSYNAKLKAVPGYAGHLFYTNGQSGVRGDANPDTADLFKRSTDGGVTWTTVANVAEVYDFGFGAPATTGGYPAIYIAGWVGSSSGNYGIWRSDNQGTSWTQIGKWPLNSLDAIKTISGDMNQHGRIYVGFGGSGYAYGDVADAIEPR
jgi:hypothetical protein